MIAVCCIRDIQDGTESITFHCKDSAGAVIHRLQGYTRDLSKEEAEGTKKELKEAYGLYLIWDLLCPCGKRA